MASDNVTLGVIVLVACNDDPKLSVIKLEAVTYPELTYPDKTYPPPPSLRVLVKEVNYYAPFDTDISF